MLTDSEREWLKDRRNKAYCRYCSVIYLCSNPNASGFKCPLIPDYKDAAEFSERVAATLANIHFGTEDCPYCSNHINVNEYCGECKTASTDKRCLACRIKYARQQVEEEMDG